MKKFVAFSIHSGAASHSLLAFRVPVAASPTFNLSASILGGTLALAVTLLLVAALWRKLTQLHPNEAEDLSQPPPLPGPGRVATWWCQPLDWGGLALITAVFSLFGLSQAYASEEPTLPKISPALLITNIMIFVFLVVMVVSFVGWRVRPVAWLGLRWRQWYHALLIGPAAVILMWLVLGMLQFSGYIAWLEQLIGGSSTQDAVKMLRHGSDNLTVAMMAFSAVVVAPVAEEVIFRGYLYPVAKKFTNLRVGMLFSALVFAAGHGNVPLLLPLFLLGLILAAVYEWTGSLWASISVHFCFNAATVAIQLAARAGLLDIPEQLP